MPDSLDPIASTVARVAESGGSRRIPAKVRTPATGPPTPSASSIKREVFEQFPYCMVVIDDSGRIVLHNARAARLIEAAGLRGEDLTCCALLGCRQPGTVLSEACISRLAIVRGEPLPEMRLDIQVGEQVEGFWVTAAPFGEHTSQVIVELRPGVARDRRRRTDPHWMKGPSIRIRTLGRVTIESSEGPIGGQWLDQRTGQLLKYLVAARNRPVHAEEIGESLWPGADFAIAGSVRYYIHALRRKLEPERGKRAPSAFVISRAGGYCLDLELVKVDADEFESHILVGLAAAKTDRETAAEEIELALALYKGDFLPDLPYAEWAIAERQRLHDLMCTGLRSLADIRLEGHLIDSAMSCLERLAAMQPYDEAVHRELIELDVLRGRRSDAIRRYDALRARTRRVFGHNLDFTLADIRAPEPDIKAPEL
jgi:DNA-binding SARP family transcriptional activator